MFKEVIFLVFSVILFIIFGVIISLTNIDYTIATYYDPVKEKKPKINKTISKDDNLFMNSIRIEVFDDSTRKTVYVDKNTTELEVFAIMGGKVHQNFLTITNLLKIITNRGAKIELR
ncbi:MAG: hypothetical protein N2712_07660 [Brevinematales bacterium]|nr:hypothetical protein [Brevinematales bacterium]